MRQFQFTYENGDKFVNSLRKISQWCNSSVISTVLFQIYTSTMSRPKVETICAMIEKELPGSLYMGCSTNGNIFIGDYSESDIVVVCTVFEYFTTKVEVLQYPLSSDNVHEVTDSLIWKVRGEPWVKCVIVNACIHGMSMTQFCENLTSLTAGVQFVGGGAMNPDMNSDHSFVFSSSGVVDSHGVVFTLIGGEDYNVETTYITGWKPLGRNLLVTKAENQFLYELDGKPAFETYYKYLNIKNDENFFDNTLEFPFFYESNGINILRAPIASNPDGSLVLTADIKENVYARIAYGDPSTILEQVKETAEKLREFIPESITIFSCAARKAFWGSSEIGKETLPFQSLAPTSGFYTSGEFLRTRGHVNQHNVTLAILAQREGKRDLDNIPSLDFTQEDFSGKVSMINRLATFIQASTEELEQANEQLRKVAILDGLTGVFNRREIQRRITDKVKEVNSEYDEKSSNSLIMVDIDDFKQVNDTYGHKEGDLVLQKIAEMMKNVATQHVSGASVGRWGGEEFMVLLPDTDVTKAQGIAELMRVNYSMLSYENAPAQTITLGVTEFIPGEEADTWCMRVDTALYSGKRDGKNKVVVK